MPWSIDSIPAVCITLERRADRWQRFQDQPGLPAVKRFLGVDGKTLNLDTDDRITTLTKRNIKTKTRRSHEELDSVGGVGCALSHIAVWQWMVDHNQEMCIIFEDDAVVPADFKEKANQIIKDSMVLKNPKQWDIWLLGGKWEDMSRIPNETKVVRVGAFVLFHAYVLTLDAAKQLLKNAYPIHCHIDMWTSIHAYLTDMRIVGSRELVLQQNQKVKTDIQSEDGCAICNVPAEFTETHRLVTHNEWRVAQASQVVCVALIAYVVYQALRVNK
jgi:GR25 family glycosyltransferase involved in LPS biosynthesis